MTYRAMIIAGVLSVSTHAFAQSPPQPAEILKAGQLKEMGGTMPALLSGPSSAGKEALFRRGIQGQTSITGIVGVDGAVHDSTVAASSGSDELDTFALSLLAQSRFAPAKDKAGTAVPVRVTVPIFLWKDSIADGSIFSKTCADFVLDADWHAKTFPHERPDQLRGWVLFNGARLAAQISAGAKAAPTPAFDVVYAACKAKPSRKFADVFLGK